MSSHFKKTYVLLRDFTFCDFPKACCTVAGTFQTRWKACCMVAGTFQMYWKACCMVVGTFQMRWKACCTTARTFQTRWKACYIAARRFRTRFYGEFFNKKLKNDLFVEDFVKNLFLHHDEKNEQ